jgi:hypothetical protein
MTRRTYLDRFLSRGPIQEGGPTDKTDETPEIRGSVSFVSAQTLTNPSGEAPPLPPSDGSRFGWVEWARRLTPDEWGRWRRRAEAIRRTLPGDLAPIEALEEAQRLAWIERKGSGRGAGGSTW